MTSEEELKLEKLRLEIEDLKGKFGWRQKLISALPMLLSLLTTLVSVVGLFYNLTFLRHQIEKDKESLKMQIEKDNQTRADEFLKPIYQKRLELYTQAVDLASIITTLPPEEKARIEAEKRFEQLYIGQLHMVAGKVFTNAKIEFYKCLKMFSDKPQCIGDSRNSELSRLSLVMAAAAEEEIPATWQNITDSRKPVLKEK